MMNLMDEMSSPGDNPGENEKQAISSKGRSSETSPELISSLKGAGQATLEMLMDVTLQLAVELGRTRMSVRQVLDLQKGSVVELNRNAGDPVDVFVNDHLIARGEVVVVDDKFGIRITELVSQDKENGED
jgi:flagellar motor switch protein FliN